MSASSTSSVGMTLVETLVATAILLPVVMALAGFMVPLAQQASARQVQLRTVEQVSRAQDTISRDIATATGFRLTTDSGLSDPYGPDNAGTAWSASANPDGSTSTLILRRYATTASPTNPARQLVYRDVNGCAAGTLDSNPPLEVNVIYFVRSGTLYRRTLLDGSLAACATPYQKQTCPADTARPWNTTCQDVDLAIATGVSTFTVVFQTTGGGTGAQTLALPASQAQIDTAEGIDVDLTLSRQNGAVTHHDGRVTFKENN